MLIINLSSVFSFLVNPIFNTFAFIHSAYGYGFNVVAPGFG